MSFHLSIIFFFWLKLLKKFDMIRKNNATLRRDITFFKMIIAPTLKEFCYKVKAIHFQDTTKSPITKKQISLIPLKSIQFEIVYLIVH